MVWRRKVPAIIAFTGLVSTSFTIYWNAKKMQEFLSLYVCKKAASAYGISLEAEKVSFNRGHFSFDEGRIIRSVSGSRNYSAFDITFENVSFQISLSRWIRRKGLVASCSLKGIRGTIDRKHIDFKKSRDFKEIRKEVFFDIEDFKISDLLVTVQSGNNFRSFNISILSAFLPRMRSEWVLFDIMMAESIVGIFDKSLFSLHSRQNLPKWRHFKIDGLKVDHLGGNNENPMSWFDRGVIDIDAGWSLEGSDLRLKFDSTLKDLHAMHFPIQNIFKAAISRPLVAYLNDTRPFVTLSDILMFKTETFRNCWTLYDSEMSIKLAQNIKKQLLEKAEANRAEGMRSVGLWSLWQLIRGVSAIT